MSIEKFQMCARNRWDYSFPLLKNINILLLKHLFYFKVLQPLFKRSYNNTVRTMIYAIPLHRTRRFAESYDFTARHLYNLLQMDLILISAGNGLSFLVK